MGEIQWCHFKCVFKYICIELNEVQLTQVIQLCKNIIAMKIVLIVLTFHAQDLTTDCGYIMFNV